MWNGGLHRFLHVWVKTTCRVSSKFRSLWWPRKESDDHEPCCFDDDRNQQIDGVARINAQIIEDQPETQPQNEDRLCDVNDHEVNRDSADSIRPLAFEPDTSWQFRIVDYLNRFVFSISGRHSQGLFFPVMNGPSKNFDE